MAGPVDRLASDGSGTAPGPSAQKGQPHMGKVTYSGFAFAGYVDGAARFTVTRTLPDDNVPVAWVYVGADARPVVWGTFDSPTGYADIPMPEGAHGTAWLTTDPSKQPRRGLSVTF